MTINLTRSISILENLREYVRGASKVTWAQEYGVLSHGNLRDGCEGDEIPRPQRILAVLMGVQDEIILARLKGANCGKRPKGANAFIPCQNQCNGR